MKHEQLTLNLTGSFQPPARVASAALTLMLRDDTHRHLLATIAQAEANPELKNQIQFSYRNAVHPYQNVVFDLNREEDALRLKKHITESMQKTDMPQPIIITPFYIGVDPGEHEIAFVHHCQTRQTRSGPVVVDFAMRSRWTRAVPFESQMILQGRTLMQAGQGPDALRFITEIKGDAAINLWRAAVPTSNKPAATLALTH